MAVPAGMSKRPPRVMSCELLTLTCPIDTGGYILRASCINGVKWLSEARLNMRQLLVVKQQDVKPHDDPTVSQDLKLV